MRKGRQVQNKAVYGSPGAVTPEANVRFWGMGCIMKGQKFWLFGNEQLRTGASKTPDRRCGPQGLSRCHQARIP